ARQRARFVRLCAAKLGQSIAAMSLPGQIALSSRLRAAITPVASVSMPARPSLSAQVSQALILGGLIGFQALDSLTTHLGLALQHEELNRLMAPIMAT